MPPTPLLESFKRGEVPRDVRLLAAQGELAPRAFEQLSILVTLLDDEDQEIKAAAETTLSQIPDDSVRAVLAEPDAPVALREFFAARGLQPASNPSVDINAALIDTAPEEGEELEAAGSTGDPEKRQEAVVAQLARMNFPQRLKAAMKGSREVRAVLIRDPNKMIASAVLSSPKLTENEVEGFARMAQLSEDTLRVIATNRSWVKNYNIMLGLTKNPKTPLAMSLNMMPRLQERDVRMLATDRNVPEPLRVAARKRAMASTNGQRRGEE